MGRKVCSKILTRTFDCIFLPAKYALDYNLSRTQQYTSSYREPNKYARARTFEQPGVQLLWEKVYAMLYNVQLCSYCTAMKAPHFKKRVKSEFIEKTVVFRAFFL